MEEARLLALQESLGYRFMNGGLLQRALCHSSYANEHSHEGVRDNERLEFLGDAVLNLAIGHHLMERFVDTPEGDLSRMRAALVNEAHLAQLARGLDLGAHLLLGKGEASTGGGDKDSILANALEAVLGAVYLDGGFEMALRLVGFLVGPSFPNSPCALGHGDHKSRLQEHLQTTLRRAPRYTVLEEVGPDHDKTFRIQAAVGGMTAIGVGKTKKAAEQDAARQALILLGVQEADTASQ